MHFYGFQSRGICWKTVPDLGCDELTQTSEDVLAEVEVVVSGGS